MPYKDKEKRNEIQRKKYAAAPEKFLRAGREWREKNLDKDREDKRIYYAANKEKVRIKNRKWLIANRDRVNKKARDSRLVRKYGVTKFTRDAILKNQGGVCAICGIDTPGGTHNVWPVDHIRGTKIVRGIPCHSCNVGLGLFKHSSEALRSAAKYIDGVLG